MYVMSSIALKIWYVSLDATLGLCLLERSCLALTDFVLWPVSLSIMIEPSYRLEALLRGNWKCFVSSNLYNQKPKLMVETS